VRGKTWEEIEKELWKGEIDELAWLPEKPHIMEMSKEGKTEEL
jgi:hypothetical protein